MEKDIKKIPGPLVDLLESQIADLMQQMRIPGMSISIISEDSIIYNRAFGARNLETNLPVTTDTLFGIGSCTKSFTALAILQLVQEGKISLDAFNRPY